jgi:hypothetical protein
VFASRNGPGPTLARKNHIEVHRIWIHPGLAHLKILTHEVRNANLFPSYAGLFQGKGDAPMYFLPNPCSS